MRNNKKGSLAKFQGIVVTLMVIGVLVGATLLALGAFRDSIGETHCASRSGNITTWDAGRNACIETGGNGADSAGADSATNGTTNWVTSSTNLSSKAPTAGTLFGIGLIIVAVFGGIFAFMRARGI